MEFVTILNSVHQSKDSQPGNTANTEMRIGSFETEALVLVTASGHADYDGPGAPAGVVLLIFIDDNQESESLSFEGDVGSLRFRTSTSYQFLLKKGRVAKVQARIFPEGFGGIARNANATVNLQCFALAAKVDDADLR
jgi:hypothetical protein